MKQTSWTGLSSGLSLWINQQNRSQDVKLNCFLPEKRKKNQDQESGQSSLTRAQERPKGASPSRLHCGNCTGPAYTSCLQSPPKQTAKHFSGMDARVINQGLRHKSRTLNVESTWEGAAQRDVLCCRTGGSPVRHGSLWRGRGDKEGWGTSLCWLVNVI